MARWYVNFIKKITNQKLIVHFVYNMSKRSTLLYGYRQCQNVERYFLTGSKLTDLTFY